MESELLRDYQVSALVNEYASPPSLVSQTKSLDMPLDENFSN